MYRDGAKVPFELYETFQCDFGYARQRVRFNCNGNKGSKVCVLLYGKSKRRGRGSYRKSYVQLEVLKNSSGILILQT